MAQKIVEEWTVEEQQILFERVPLYMTVSVTDPIWDELAERLGRTHWSVLYKWRNSKKMALNIHKIFDDIEELHKIVKAIKG